MNNVERILFGVILLGAGIAIGMYYEHQRFIREVQGLKRQHDDTPSPATPPPPQAPDPQPEGVTA